ncbi:pancreatic triacylglycerol lipase-like [Homarus americanus]|uniref:pancreatic triacylglycerol lipase-like n=1 Tax=Homarus americanus TaxID=6706 RepID=UPI001C4895DB|nr:pancreatic triacylglycerol lipase-like [Homarus americanus]
MRTKVWWLVVTAAVAGAQDISQGILSGVMSGLRELPVIGNVLRAAVHPLYMPLVRQFQPRINSREGENEFTEMCFGELGCILSDDDFFHPIHRPLNLPPNSREEIHVVFTVHTREDSQGTQVEGINVTKVLNTFFNPKRKTKFLIHGFLDHTGVTWMWDMVRALLVYDDYNVVTVDWSGGSRALYSQATANTRVVGLEVAHFINWLKDNALLDPKDVHIIGHSLGSHTAGYAGERVSGLGRITGLDPAEPFFQYMPPSVRLDPSDAMFVDVIHTDIDSILNLGTGSGYGLRQPVGHLDFYPNDGRNQPGCNSLTRVPFAALTDGLSLYEGLDAAQKELVACSHNRAAKLFTDSILSTCPYTAFQCPSYQQYISGKCASCGEDGSGCARLGLHADKWPGSNQNQSLVSLYLTTTAGPLFCLYHYRLMLELADPGKVEGSLRGKLKVSFITEDGSIEDFDLTEDGPVNLSRGKMYSFFLYHNKDLSTASEALVQWTYETDMFNPMSYCVLFCDTSLSLSKLVFTSVDYLVAEDVANRTNEVVMCHQQGLGVVRIVSEATVKVVSSPSCLNITTQEVTRHHPVETIIANRHNETMELLNAGFASISSIFSIK